ncbi:MAG: hypothetical protein ABIP35_11295 [Ginsengibacter sp.]
MNSSNTILNVDLISLSRKNIVYNPTDLTDTAGKTNIIATTYNSGFPLSHDTYNGMYAASDGNIYYVLCSESISEGGKMYAFNPATNKIIFCGDLTEICGEKGLNTIPQGKSHVVFIENDKKLFFATHIGYYTYDNGMEIKGIPPDGYKEYPGGHLLCYDLETKEFKNLCTAPEKEGVLTMNMDVQRDLIYGITWPKGYFFRYDLKKNEMKNFGLVSSDGENGIGENFRALCRSIAINPDDGTVYFSISEGRIVCCKVGSDQLEVINEEDLKKDYFGCYNPSSPGHMGYNWRQIFWYAPHKCFYGVHGNSGYLFRFTTHDNKIDLITRLTSIPSQRSGMYDQFTYGYLGFALGPDQRTIFYLTGAPMYENGMRVIGKLNSVKGEAKGLEHLHLVTYDLIDHKYQDYGSILFNNGESPLYVNSIAVGLDGKIYFMGRITENGSTRIDLISIHNPLFPEA